MAKPLTLLFLCLLAASCEVVDSKSMRSGENLNFADGRTVKVVDGECDEPPRFLKGRAPIFPPMLSMNGVRAGGTVIRYKVTVDGKVGSHRIVSASNKQFAAGVFYVMPTWEFAPATLRGKPVEVVVEGEFNFDENHAIIRLKK